MPLVNSPQTSKEGEIYPFTPIRMLVKYIGTTTELSVDDGCGNVYDLTPGDVINVAASTMLWERFPTKFTLVRFGTELLQKKITLTAAQVKALNTTPIALVAAPGAGYFVDVFAVTASIPTYVSAAYATNTTMEVRYTN